MANILILGPEWMGASKQADALAIAQPQHYSLKTSEGLLGESHLWSHLRTLLQSGRPVYLTGFSGLDPILQASLLDWLQNAGGNSQIILQMDSEPMPALRELSFYKRCQIIKLIPLKDRKTEVAQVAREILAHYNRYYAKEVPGFEPQFLQWLQNYAWPGDVAELDALICERVLDWEEGPLRRKLA